MRIGIEVSFVTQTFERAREPARSSGDWTEDSEVVPRAIRGVTSGQYCRIPAVYPNNHEINRESWGLRSPEPYFWTAGGKKLNVDAEVHREHFLQLVF